MTTTSDTESDLAPRANRQQRKASRRRGRAIVLALLIGAPFLLAAACAVGRGSVMTWLGRSDAYAASFKYVAQHGLVMQELGSPINAGLKTGMLRVNPAGGDSQLVFEICGPERCADAFVVAQGLGGQWRVVDAVLTLNGKTYDIGPG